MSVAADICVTYILRVLDFVRSYVWTKQWKVCQESSCVARGSFWGSEYCIKSTHYISATVWKTQERERSNCKDVLYSQVNLFYCQLTKRTCTNTCRNKQCINIAWHVQLYPIGQCYSNYRTAESCLPGRRLTPEIHILYRAFRTIRKYSTVSILR